MMTWLPPSKTHVVCLGEKSSPFVSHWGIRPDTLSFKPGKWCNRLGHSYTSWLGVKDAGPLVNCMTSGTSQALVSSSAM